MRSISKTLEKFKTGCGKYAILGDSITDSFHGGYKCSGGASDDKHGYAYLLEQFVKEKFGEKIEFTNSGYGGNTTLQATERIDEQIIPFDFDIIGVALGTNDWNLQNDLTSFELQYENLIKRLLNETDAALFIVSPGYFHNWKEENKIREDEYNKIIFKIAEKYDIPVVDTRSAMIKYMDENSADFNDITFVPDPVHPNDIGHNIWYTECKKIFIDN